jgi:hypothetical protein
MGIFDKSCDRPVLVHSFQTGSFVYPISPRRQGKGQEEGEVFPRGGEKKTTGETKRTENGKGIVEIGGKAD